MGSGAPSTLFVHGLGGSITETRPLSSGVRGTRVFLHLPGHGRSTAPPSAAGPTYADLAAAVLAVADHTGATRALGVSLGAGALTRLAAQAPKRFERLVFFLPAVLDSPRSAQTRALLERMADALDDPARLSEFVAAELPAAVRATPTARLYIADRVARLRRPDIGGCLRGLAGQVAIEDRALLSRVEAAVLVLGCEGDLLHPAAVARELAAAVGGAQLRVFPEAAPLWTARAEVRDRITRFLNTG